MIDFIVDNHETLLSVATGLIALASALAALTPSPTDDGIVAALRRLLDLVALNVGHARPKR